MHRVLLLRPLEDALPIQVYLKSKNIEFIHHPLFQPHFLPVGSLENPQALIITSKNALRALEDSEELKKIPVYTVGDQTAELAKKVGFLNILNAAGTSQDLISLITKTANRDKGILWHLSGEYVRGNLVELLQESGFEAKRKIIYFIEDIENISPSLYSEFTNKKISHILFFSPRTTNVFINILKMNKLEMQACQLTALCLSKEIGKAALSIKWKKVWISPQPNLKALIGYFDEKR